MDATAYCVRIATVVPPTTLPVPSRASTRMRLRAGSNGMFPVPCANTANVGVSLDWIVTVTLGASDPRHAPVGGLVWQMNRFTGSTTPPVFADNLIDPEAPTFTVATEKNPVPVSPGMFTIPGTGGGVADNITMSVMGDAEAKNCSVLTPVMIAAAAVLLQSNENRTSTGTTGSVGVSEKT